MSVGEYPATQYGMYPTVSAPTFSPPSGVYRGVSWDHQTTTTIPNPRIFGTLNSSNYPSHVPPPHLTAARYNYRNSCYYPEGQPLHQTYSNYQQGSSRY